MKKAKELAGKAVDAERALATLENEFKMANPQLREFLKDQKEIQAKITDMWNQVKQTLIEANYTDVLENDNFKISISKVANLKVEDVEKLPEEYTEVIKSPKMDKIKKHFELYEEVPAGVIDASYFRLNKTIKEA